MCPRNGENPKKMNPKAKNHFNTVNIDFARYIVEEQDSVLHCV